MLDQTAKKSREVSSIVYFLLATGVGCYLIYLAVIIPWEIGMEKGAIAAAYRPAIAPAEEGEQVFDQRELYQPTADLVSFGRAVYTQNCASCHGPEGYGDGSAGRGLAVRPRNFHGELGDWKIGASTLQMYESLEVGVAPAMPAFAHLNPRQRFAVIHFIHAEFMADREIPQDDPALVAALPGPTESVQVSIDPYKEDRIPVDVAIKQLLAEKSEN